MTRPTRFQIMRANRARSTLETSVQRYLRVTREVEQAEQALEAQWREEPPPRRYQRDELDMLPSQPVRRWWRVFIRTPA